MSDPFKIPEPFVVSFSGGRTSGYMLRRILDAFGGNLPDGGKVVFCNTGKERPETLDFVERCSVEWDVPVVWLEYRYDGKPGLTVVDYATASRNGEPFEASIRTRLSGSGYLPNPMVRYCTIELKIKLLVRYLKSLGWDHWTNAVGLRADEPRRVEKARANAAHGHDSEFPLFDAGVTRADVDAYWAASPFRLALGPDESNCDLCFLKGRGKLVRLMRKWPEAADWWAGIEAMTGNRFRNDRPRYELLLAESKQPTLFDGLDEPDELGIACHCTD